MNEVLRLAELVQYQTGSVVSRTLIKKKAGTVTLFAFAEGEGLSEHTAPYDALVHVLEGEAEVKLAGDVHQVRTGEAIVMLAGVPHALQAVQQFKMLLTMVKSSE